MEQEPGPRGSPQLPQAPDRCRRHGCAFGLHRKYGKFCCQVLTLAFWAAGFLFSDDQGFKGILAISASVFKYGH